MVVKSTARCTWATGGGISRINCLPERRLCQSYVQPTRLCWAIFQAISMPGCCISQFVIVREISAGNQNTSPGFSSGWCHVPWMVPKWLVKHGIMRLELCCLNLGILTSLALAWNGIVEMDSSDNVTLCWLPGLGIIQNTLWLLKSHWTYACCAKFLKVHRLGIPLFNHLISQEISIFTQSSLRTIL